jgi:hypothetical protein
MEAAAFSGVICVSISYSWQDAAAPSKAKPANILVRVFIWLLFLIMG